MLHLHTEVRKDMRERKRRHKEKYGGTLDFWALEFRDSPSVKNVTFL